MMKIELAFKHPLEQRDKEIALKFLQSTNGTSLRQFARDADVSLSIVHRAVKRWREWASAEIAAKESA